MALSLASAASFGLAFVGITWALEGAAHVRKAMSEGADFDEAERYKEHVIWMYRKIDGEGDSRLRLEGYPLQKPGNLFALWNIGMLASFVMLGVLALLLGGRSTVVAPSLCLCATCFVRRVLYSGKHDVCVATLAAAVVAFAVIYLSPEAQMAADIGAACAVTLSAMCAHLAVFALFRRLNYEEMTSALDAIMDRLVMLRHGIWIALVGRTTAEMLGGE